MWFGRRGCFGWGRLSQPPLGGFTFWEHQCAASMPRPLTGLAAVRLETPIQPSTVTRFLPPCFEA